MEFVEPIRNKKQLEAMKKYLLAHNQRDYVLFVLGINCIIWSEMSHRSGM